LDLDFGGKNEVKVCAVRRAIDRANSSNSVIAALNYELLTTRELEVMGLVVSGMLNKQISF
jgi:FixJ family two-component response regulator